jgi:photosystem II stability/assembly factor-like uncharacterized protein
VNSRLILGLWFLAVGVSPAAAQKWQIQYFYDHAKSSFGVTDLQFASATRGVAVGFIRDGKRDEPTSVITADGGLHWQTVPLKEMPVSLFFLNENLGWMVTTKGLWQTADSGKTWTKLPKLIAEIYRVHFVDEQHGWAIGPRKTAMATQNGGKSWTQLGAATPTFGENTDYSAYTWITFATPRIGLITGWNMPPNRNAPELPDWVNPEATLDQRETAHLSYTLATVDGGVTWTPSSRSLFGTIARIRFAPEANRLGLMLMQYSGTFRYPSEVYSLQWPGGATHTVYRDTKFAVSDVWLAADGTAYLAGTAVRGKLRNVIPEKVQVLTSKDLENWTSMPVDYHAEATSVILAGSGNDLWMATDSGIILKLMR